MRTLLLGLTLCVTCFAESADVEAVVPPSAAHPQDWLHPQFRSNPNPNYQGKTAGSLAEFVTSEVMSKIVVDQYAGPPTMSAAISPPCPQPRPNTGLSLELCEPPNPNPKLSPPYGARLDWTSTSTVLSKAAAVAGLPSAPLL
jgi:hypothetical protein